MTAREQSPIARALAPLAGTLWVLFFFWSAVILALWTTGFGEAELNERVANTGLRNALVLVIGAADALWITLGAAGIYLSLAVEEGIATARRWALLTIIVSALIALLSHATGFPLGAIGFTPRLGMRIGPVPFALPLLWLLFVTGARSLALRFAPRASHAQAALLAGIAVALADVNLELLAWKVRAWWIWYPRVAPAPPWPPIQNFVTWFAGSSALVWTMREQRVGGRDTRSFPRAAIVFLVFNAIFLATHVVRRFVS
jgi:uncharacterized membrane protein